MVFFLGSFVRVAVALAMFYGLEAVTGISKTPNPLLGALITGSVVIVAVVGCKWLSKRYHRLWWL